MKNRLILIVTIILGGFLITLFILVLLSSKPASPIQTSPTPTSVSFEQPPHQPQKSPDWKGSEDQQFKQNEKAFLQRTPILQKLTTNPYFDIEYMSETFLVVHPRITDTQKAYDEANKWFKNNGIETSVVRIEYR